MRKVLLTAALVLSSGCAVQAADLIIVPEGVPPAVVASPSIYVQLLGGAAVGLDVDFFEAGILDSSYEMDIGGAAAASIGVMVMENLAIEGDVLWTDRVFTTEPDYDLSTLSVMVNVKAFLPLADMFTLYGAVGVGHISYSVNPQDSGDYGGFGYQLIGGVSADVAENIAIVGEVRFQDTFSEAPDTDFDLFGIRAPTVSVLGGVKLSF